MKIFKVIWKAWLQHRVDKYTLKYEDFSSKSERFCHLAENYQILVSDFSRDPRVYVEKIEKYNLSVTKYFNKSDHCLHLSNMYLDKKLNLEEKLQYYRRA